MDERSIKSIARHRNVRLFQEKPFDELTADLSEAAANLSPHSAPSMMIFTIVSSMIIAVMLVGFFLLRYVKTHQRKTPSTEDGSYSVSRYWRRQLTSNSYDQLVPLTKREKTKIDEEHRTIKSSFSWPEGPLTQQQTQPPKTDRVDDSSSSTISTSSTVSNSSTMEQISEPASLTFSLRWNNTTKSLWIRLINARNLRRSRSMNLLDSYVRIELISSNSQESFTPTRTHIVKKNLHPVFDELFEYSNLNPTNDEKSYTLLFTVLTYDTFTRDEVLGQVQFSVGSVELIEEFEAMERTFTREITPRHVQLSNQSLGQILISMSYQPSESTLTFILLKASNLPQLDPTRMLNPYVKIYMFYKGQRLMKKRSTIKRTTQSPVYNESFTFQIPENDLFNTRFDLILFDYDRHRKHEPIGLVKIGETNGSSEIQQQWSDICQQRMTKQIAQWYPFHPLSKFSA